MSRQSTQLHYFVNERGGVQDVGRVTANRLLEAAPEGMEAMLTAEYGEVSPGWLFRAWLRGRRPDGAPTRILGRYRDTATEAAEDLIRKLAPA